MKTAIVGSRTLHIDNFESYLPEGTTEIISGGAKGIDTCAKLYCDKTGLTISEILPEYEKYGRGAPIVRNRKIINDADFVLIFWDGVSKGTKFIIDGCRKNGKSHKIYIIYKT